MNFKTLKIILILFCINGFAFSQTKLFIPMEVSGQTNHLKAYGIAYRHLLEGRELDWLLNYRGGSFMFDYSSKLENECKAKDVSYELLDGTATAQVYADVK